MSGTVKDGQAWTDDFIRKHASKMGFPIRAYWRQPDNGIDWRLELARDDSDESVHVPIWYYYLKQLDRSSKSRIQAHVKKALDRLR